MAAEPIQKANRDDGGFRMFTIQLIVLAVLFTTATYAAIYLRTRALLYESLRIQAENHFELVVTARAWNADHNGVWVKKTPGVETNPYLEELGIVAEIETTAGETLTLRNPAIMASEISERLESRMGVTYHLVAIDPVNPENLPTEWEREGLVRFSEDPSPVHTIESLPSGRRVYRYMEPLVVESDCVICHAAQDYRIGQIAGATSIGIPVADIERQLAANALTLLLLGGLSIAAAVSSIGWMTSRLGQRARQANELLERAAITDELTGLLNRRGTLQRLDEELARFERSDEPLSVVMLDLDLFKAVNDTHGHAVGDSALRHVADAIRAEVRAYDVVGRFGGEEFLIITPYTEIGAAVALAERVRERVSAETVVPISPPVMITVSGGVAQARNGESVDQLVARADFALYKAKETGRDRIEWSPGAPRPSAGRNGDVDS